MGFMDRVHRMGDSFRNAGKKTKLKATIQIYNREIYSRKQKFGIDCYDLFQRKLVDNITRTVNTEMNNDGESTIEPPKVMELFTNAYNEIGEKEERKQLAQCNIAIIDANARLEITAGYYTTQTPSNTQGASVDVTDSTRSMPETTTTKRSKGNNRAAMMQQQRHSSYSTTDMKHSMVAAGHQAMAVASKSKFHAEIMMIDREINNRKQEFGVAVYDVMVTLYDLEGYEGYDLELQGLLGWAKSDINEPLHQCLIAEDELHAIEQAELQTGPTISHREIASYIEQNPSMWAMLSVNIDITDVEAKVVAARVVIELMSGLLGRQGLKATLYQAQFDKFKTEFIDNPKGSQEFFHRCVFAAFDTDGNSVLDIDETDKFLDTFYVSGSIFQGDTRLPEKEELKKLIMDKLDINGDGEFTFDEIRALISGSAARGDLTSGSSSTNTNNTNTSPSNNHNNKSSSPTHGNGSSSNTTAAASASTPKTYGEEEEQADTYNNYEADNYNYDTADTTSFAPPGSAILENSTIPEEQEAVIPEQTAGVVEEQQYYEQEQYYGQEQQEKVVEQQEEQVITPKPPSKKPSLGSSSSSPTSKSPKSPSRRSPKLSSSSRSTPKSPKANSSEEEDTNTAPKISISKSKKSKSDKEKKERKKKKRSEKSSSREITGSTPNFATT